MWKEFKEFAMRGSVIDMAVGVIIGGAFSAVVNSIVNDIFMPIIGQLLAGVDFSDLKIVLSQAVVEAGEVVQPEVAIGYGMLIQKIINFLIIALCLFAVIKSINSLKKSEPKEEPAPPEKSAEVLLLEEIRDSLKEGSHKQ
ncbi:MAG: large-conductance mechanosensitive channel protein MscL [Eubacteriales bacterium]|nr:large-conductance mechanosensitive channel protein MscL [Eubacteriales bacterium]